MKSLVLSGELHSELFYLSPGEGSGIPGVEVKFVEIGRNTRGESGFLDGD